MNDIIKEYVLRSIRLSEKIAHNKGFLVECKTDKSREYWKSVISLDTREKETLDEVVSDLLLLDRGEDLQCKSL